VKNRQNNVICAFSRIKKMPFSEGIIISGLEKFNGRATMEFDILV
jgi:hypothetical protein